MVNLLVKAEKGRPIFYLGPIESPSINSIYIRNAGIISAKFRVNKYSDELVTISFPCYRIPSWSLFNDFLEANKIADKDIQVSVDSIDCFYNFNHVFSVNLTKGFVDEWWNLDCPFLYKYIVNKHNGHTILGMEPPVFYGSLIETSFNQWYFDDVSEEEIDKLFRDHQGAWAAEQARSYLEAKSITKENLEKMVNVIRSYDEKIQGVIDKYSEEIKRAVADVPDSFPCGFMNVYVKADDWVKAKKILEHHPSKHDFNFYGSCNVHMPIGCQGLDLQYAQFNVAKLFVKAELGIDLYKNGTLD